MGQKVGNFVPASSLQRQTTNNMMDFQRKASGFWENSFMQFAPYLVENKAYDGYGNPIEPNRGIAFRKRNIQETDLAETLYAENSFLPTRPKFKYLYSKSDGGMNKTPSATIDLGKLGLWNKWNEMRADGMGLAIRDFINSQEYSDNMKANRVDENRTAIQSIINTKNKRAFEDLMREHPIIEREVMRSQGEKIIEKQKGKGYVSGVSNVPTFMGE